MNHKNGDNPYLQVNDMQKRFLAGHIERLMKSEDMIELAGLFSLCISDLVDIYDNNVERVMRCNRIHGGEASGGDTPG